MSDVPQSEPITSEEVDRLITELGPLQKAIEDLSDKLDRADQRSRRAQNLGTIGIIAVVVAIVLAIGAWRATVDIRATRAEGRISACFQENRSIGQTRVAIVEGSAEALKSLAVDPSNLTPDEQALRDAYRTRLATTVEALLPYRDCSPEGIDRFYDNPPPDPSTVDTVA